MASAVLSDVQISLIRPLVRVDETTGRTPPALSPAGMNDAWDRTLNDLLRLRGLEDNWDGQGATAPNPANVDAATAWIQQMRRWERALPPARVVPGVLGEVHVVWQREAVYLDAEISDPHQVEWLLSLPGEPTRQWKTDLAQTWLVGLVARLAMLSFPNSVKAPTNVTRSH